MATYSAPESHSQPLKQGHSLFIAHFDRTAVMRTAMVAHAFQLPRHLQQKQKIFFDIKLR